MGREQGKSFLPKEIDIFNKKGAGFEPYFSDTAREKLENQGYTITFVKERSLKELNQEKRSLGGWLREEILFRGAINSKCKPGEVAYKPEDPFLEEGSNRTYNEQSKMLREHVDSQGIPGTEGVIEHLAVYAQLEENTPFIGEKSVRTSLKVPFTGEKILIRFNDSKRTILPRFGFEKYKDLCVVKLIRPKKPANSLGSHF